MHLGYALEACLFVGINWRECFTRHVMISNPVRFGKFCVRRLVEISFQFLAHYRAMTQHRVCKHRTVDMATRLPCTGDGLVIRGQAEELEQRMRWSRSRSRILLRSSSMSWLVAISVAAESSSLWNHLPGFKAELAGRRGRWRPSTSAPAMAMSSARRALSLSGFPGRPLWRTPWSWSPRTPRWRANPRATWFRWCQNP